MVISIGVRRHFLALLEESHAIAGETVAEPRSREKL
jgi:hypothetical protein